MEYLTFSYLYSSLGFLWCLILYLSLLSSWVYFCARCKLVVEVHFFFFFCMYLSRSPKTICLRGYFYSILCFCPLCQILIDHRDLGLFLGSLFCSISLWVCSYATTRLFWLLWPCNMVWYQVLWPFLLCSSFSTLLQLFGVVYGSI